MKVEGKKVEVETESNGLMTGNEQKRDKALKGVCEDQIWGNKGTL